MPKASASITETERHDLKSCEGGYIEARRLSYGEKLQRRAMVSHMKLSGNRKKGNDDFLGEMQLVNEKATAFDFQRCILDHNLFKDDEETQKFDFSKVSDIQQLDPRIGEEIDTFLSELNNFEDDEEN